MVNGTVTAYAEMRSSKLHHPLRKARSAAFGMQRKPKEKAMTNPQRH